MPTSQNSSPQAARYPGTAIQRSRDHGRHKAVVNAQQACRRSRLFGRVLALVPHQPYREHRHQRAGQQVGGDHGESHRQGQRHEQRANRLVQDEGGNEDREDAEHGQEAGRGRGRGGPPRRPGHGVRVEHLGMGVLDGHHGLVHEDPDGQRQPAQRHDVERVARQATGRPGRRSRSRGCSPAPRPRSARRGETTRIISPVSPAPIRPSVATLLMAARTVGDSSNS